MQAIGQAFSRIDSGASKFLKRISQEDGNIDFRIRLAILFVIASLIALILYTKGQPLICECGYIKFWENDIYSGGNSQHLFDWYSLSHFLHGVLIVLVWRLFLPRLPMRYVFLVGVFTGFAWEIIEHMDYVLNRFRESTISLGYFGDSVLNSVSDYLTMSLGLLIATKLRMLAIVSLVLTVEIFGALAVRESLALSTIMLLHPIPSVKTWQMEIAPEAVRSLE